MAALSFACRVMGCEVRGAWEAVEEVPEKSNGRHVRVVRDALNPRAWLCSGEPIEQGLM